MIKRISYLTALLVCLVCANSAVAQDSLGITLLPGEPKYWYDAKSLVVRNNLAFIATGGAD